MGLIYLASNEALEINTEEIKETIVVEVGKYITKAIIYKSKDGKQIITNLVPGVPNAS